MTVAAWITLCVIAVSIAAMATNRSPPDIALMGATSLLLITGIITPAQAFAGFSNEGVLTVAALFVVVAGLQETGAVSWLGGWLLGRPRSLAMAQLRLMVPISGISAFLNNTPIVAMFIPVVSDWAKKLQLPPSKLMIPLSYATIVGGMITVIGTSTNLVVNGLLTNQPGLKPLNLMEPAAIGVPLTVITLIYILLASPRLLPDRTGTAGTFADVRQYIVEMLVEPNSALEGKTVEQAGLRHLPGLYLIEIERDGELIPAVSPQQKLKGNDRLIFTGVVDSVVDLQRIRGLVPATNQVFKLGSARHDRCLVEAVVAPNCPIVGKTIRAGRFRNLYQAAIIAVARDGQQIMRTKIGDIILEAGDTLLMETHEHFVDQHKNSRDFYLISQLQETPAPRHDKAIIALVIVAAMVVLAGTNLLSMLKAALLASGALILTRCVRGRVVRRLIDWQVLIAIAASFGVGAALETTGAAAAIGNALVSAAGGSPWLAVALVFVATALLTELVSNNTAAVMVFPIAVATANHLQVSAMPFVLTIMVAASCSFATPIGYQTNLMVFGPGGYRFSDFLRFGIPLTVILGIVTVFLVPRIWPF